MLVDAYLARIAVFPEIGPIYFENSPRQVMGRVSFRPFFRGSYYGLNGRLVRSG